MRSCCVPVICVPVVFLLACYRFLVLLTPFDDPAHMIFKQLNTFLDLRILKQVFLAQFLGRLCQYFYLPLWLEKLLRAFKSLLERCPD